MLDSWRWYGPLDTIDLGQIVQTGARGIVTALHENPCGEVWSIEATTAWCNLIAAQQGLHWNVAESLPVHDDIKRGTGELDFLFENYRQSLKNLSECGVKTMCYNFMQLLDWTRTRLDAPLLGGATALRLDTVEMAAFKIHMLARDGAENDYPADVCTEAQVWFENSTAQSRDTLHARIMAGLPGAYDRCSVEGLRIALADWASITREELRSNYARFLAAIIPAAEDLGMRMCVHPDDPPRDILGLPRIVTNEEDIAWVMQCEDSISNGLTLCSGSLGANHDNDVTRIATRIADRIHFAHLRNVKREANGSLQEAAHLDGDTDMIALMQVLLTEETRRLKAGHDDVDIAFRADHGHANLDDLTRNSHPGYPLIGRMRGLAELRGAMAALSS